MSRLRREYTVKVATMATIFVREFSRGKVITRGSVLVDRKDDPRALFGKAPDILKTLGVVELHVVPVGKFADTIRRLDTTLPVAIDAGEEVLMFARGEERFVPALRVISAKRRPRGIHVYALRDSKGYSYVALLRQLVTAGKFVPYAVAVTADNVMLKKLTPKGQELPRDVFLRVEPPELGREVWREGEGEEGVPQLVARAELDLDLGLGRVKEGLQALKSRKSL